jgi:tetratricopeptide (TPR) repeat protein
MNPLIKRLIKLLSKARELIKDGRPHVALVAVEMAPKLLAQPPLADRPELDERRAEVAVLKGQHLVQLGHYVEALLSLEQAATLLARPPLANQPELDKRRAEVAYLKGVCLGQLDRHAEAVTVFEQAAALLAGRPLASRPELDKIRAVVVFWTGASHVQLDRHAEALPSLEHAEMLLARANLANLPELDIIRADVAYLKGICLAEQDLYTEALVVFEQAAVLLEQLSLAGQPDLNRKRKDVAYWMGHCLYQLGYHAAALAPLKQAEELFARRPLADRPELDNDRARLAILKGRCLVQMGRHTEALASFDQSATLLARPPLADQPELDEMRAEVASSKGCCLAGLDRHAEALILLEQASVLLAQPQLVDRPKLDWMRADVAYGKGLCLAKIGRHTEALAPLEAAASLRARPHLAEKPEGRRIQMKIASLKGCCLIDLGHLAAALESFVQAEKMPVLSPFADQPEWDEYAAYIAFLKGICLYGLERHADARASFELSEKLLARPHLADKQEWDWFRALVTYWKGGCLRQLSCDAEALAVFQDTEERLARLELNWMQAEVAYWKGDCLAQLGRHAEALTSHHVAVGLWCAAASLSLAQQRHFCTTLALMSAHLLEIEAGSLAWALGMSDRLVGMLDLAPPTEELVWVDMRRSFAVFHTAWLRHCLEGDEVALAMVPRILAALQGRRLAAEVIEAALAGGEGEVPEQISALAAHKQAMRRKLAELGAAQERERLEGGLMLGPLLGAWTGDGSGRSGGAVRLPSPPRDLERIARLQSELAAMQATLAELKQQAAQVAGFEILGAPLTAVTTARLQATLAADEALIVAVPLAVDEAVEPGEPAEAGGEGKRLKQFSTHLWVLRQQGLPVQVKLAERAETVTLADTETSGPDDAAPAWSGDVAGMLARLGAFSRSLAVGRGVRRGDWEAARTPPVLNDAALSAAEMRAFWPGLEAGVARLVWAPLAASGVLEGVRTILLTTAGVLHNFPFDVGRRRAGLADRQLWHASSLVTFALGRGLFGQAGAADGSGQTSSGQTGPRLAGPELAGPWRVSLLGHGADIPMALLEQELAARIWSAGRGPTAAVVEVIRGESYPWQPAMPPVRFAHIACHGYVDRQNTPTPRPVLLLGGAWPGSLVSQRDLRQGPPTHEMLICACVAAQTFDDVLDGDPTGLISGALRAGTRTVVGALPPVPDRAGFVFGLVVTLLMARWEMPLAEAVETARGVMVELGADLGERGNGSETGRAAWLLGPSELRAALEEVLLAYAAGLVRAHRDKVMRDTQILAFARKEALHLFVKDLATGQHCWWLDLDGKTDPARIKKIRDTLLTADTSEATAADPLALLRDCLRPGLLPEADRGAAALGVLAYGMVTYGDPGARQRAAA